MSSDVTTRTKRSALLPGLAIASLGLSALLSRGNAARAASGYLFAWLFFLGLSLGSLGMLMMHPLTGGRWMAPVHRYFSAALAPFPILALLFVPVAFGMDHLFTWTAACCVPADNLQFSQFYLSSGPFLFRAGIALLVWCLWARLFRTPSGRPRSRAQCAAGLLVYVVTMTWAAVDWIASLQPRWSSSVLGLLLIASQALGAFALATACATRPSMTVATPNQDECGDLGNLLLTFVMTWMYLSFVQFLIIWAEDLPRETTWYVPRLYGRWTILTVLVTLAQFALPFMLLLFRRLKRDPTWLGRVAFLLLFGNWLYAAWLVVPTTQPTGAPISVSDLTATAGVGGLWCFAYFRSLASGRDVTRAGLEFKTSDDVAPEQSHGL